MVHVEVVEFGAEEVYGDHLFDLQLVGGRALQGASLVIDAGERDIWFETVRCLTQRYVISAGSQAT